MGTGQKQENFANRLTADPETKGVPPRRPADHTMPFPFQIFQTPDQVNIAFEYARGIRVIHTERHAASTRAAQLGGVGDSRGRWEGDTLVVDVVHFTDQTWFDRAGNFHSEALHLVERYTLEGPITCATR